MIICGDFIGSKQKICYVYNAKLNKIDKKVTFKGIGKE